jgi:hypothetical protein
MVKKASKHKQIEKLKAKILNPKFVDKKNSQTPRKKQNTHVWKQVFWKTIQKQSLVKQILVHQRAPQKEGNKQHY